MSPSGRWTATGSNGPAGSTPGGRGSRRRGRIYAVRAPWRRAGFVTLPARMHAVHTSTRRGDPFTTARTRWMFGFQRRLVRRWEWLRLIPKEGCLPQISHTAATARTLLGRTEGLNPED